MYTRSMPRFKPAVAARGIAACIALLAGCRSAPDTVDYARAYPADALPGTTVNIQVVRKGTDIELTNTTARSFGPCTLWINERFSKPLDGLKIGQTLRLSLRDFRDEHSEPFRAGGFFATDLPDKVVKAQLEVPTPGAATADSAPLASPPSDPDAIERINQTGATQWLGLIPIGREEE